MCILYCLACDEIPEDFYDSILFQGGFCSQILYALNLRKKKKGETKQTDRTKKITRTQIYPEVQQIKPFSRGL